MWLKSPVDIDVAGPVEHLGRKPDEKRRGINRPVIGNMGHFLQPSHFAVSHLVEDLSRSLIGEWVDVFTLQRRKEVKSLNGGFRVEMQRLQTHNQAVTPKWSNKPGYAGSGNCSVTKRRL